MSTIVTLVLVFLAVNYANCQLVRYRLCVTQSLFNDRLCKSLSTTESRATCVEALDSVDCAFKLRNGDAHFAVLTSEQIALVQSILDSDARIIYQVQAEDTSLKYKYRTGVVVEKSFTGTLSALRGMRYCHPGFDEVGKNDRIMKLFETKVVQQQCLSNTSVIENELDSLVNFFGNASCRPRKWTVDDNEDVRLRQKYSALCQLCDEIDQCKNNPEGNNHHYGALRCLTHKTGQVAYVSIDVAKEYFTTYSSYAANYAFLCPDGTKMDLNVAEPCAWYEEPFDAIVAANSVATDLQNILANDIIPRSVDWRSSLIELLQGSSGKLVQLNSRLSQYVTGVTADLGSSTCGQAIKWCSTSSAEQTKCNMLKQASALNAIKPDLTCIQANSVWECLNRTKNGVTDILGIDTSLAYVAIKYFNLEPVTYQDPGAENLDKTIAVIRTGAAKSFDDLKGKDACFPEFGGLAHLTIFEKLRIDTKSNAWLDGELLSNYFKQICVPRTLQIPRDPRSSDDGNKFCTLCPGNSCIVDATRSSPADVRAVECLINNTNSIAFINANNLQHVRANTTVSNRFPEDQYNFLCKDGNVLPLSQTVEETCAFASHITGLIIGNKNLSAVQLKDINLALLKMDDLFGSLDDTWFFRMYGSFNGVSDLLFKGKTLTLATNNNKYVAEFQRILKSVFSDTTASGFVVTSSTLVVFLAAVASITASLIHN